jgi:hypothetical protein
MCCRFVAYWPTTLSETGSCVWPCFALPGLLHLLGLTNLQFMPRQNRLETRKNAPEGRLVLLTAQLGFQRQTLTASPMLMGRGGQLTPLILAQALGLPG